MKEKIEKMGKSWFVYNDCEGLLLDCDLVTKIDKNVKPLDYNGEIGFYDFSSITEKIIKEIESGNLNVETTYMGSYCGVEFSGESIGIVKMKNIENEQRIIEVWDEIDEGKSDEYERELCIETNRYYHWDSELSEILGQIRDKVSYIHSNYEDDEISQEMSEMKLRFNKEWEETIGRFSNPMGHDFKIMTIDEMVEEIESRNR
jgi:hypothetical protein